MEKMIIHEVHGRYTYKEFKDESVLYPSNSVIHHFTRNGVSLQNLLRFLYITKIDYRKLHALHSKDTRMIYKNEIIKPIFRTADGDYIYIKCKNTKYCDAFLMTNSEFNQIAEEDLFLSKTAVIAKISKIDYDVLRFCRRLKIEVYLKEDCTEEVIQTIKNTKNVKKLKRMKKLMYRINNGEDTN